jgi:hypothetical protein
MAQNSRNDFSHKTIDALARRASYICSNPDCHCITLCPSDRDPEKHIYIGKAAHITAAAQGGPRYDSSLTDAQRESIENGIFLCSNCAEMVDKNNGLDYSVDLLHQWKNDHEEWVKAHLNKTPYSLINIVEGEFTAKGEGKVTAIRTKKPTLFKPGTKGTAEGIGEITGLDIE